jgi:hypothetical protein
MRRLLVCMAGALLIGFLPVVNAAAQTKPGEKPKPTASEPEKQKPATSEKAKTASGTVSAVTGTSLTVKGGKEDMTFTVDEKTKVTAAGGSTKTKEKQAAGQKTMITDFVGEGDMVSVTYHEMGAEKHAAAVRVTRKAAGKK